MVNPSYPICNCFYSPKGPIKQLVISPELPRATPHACASCAYVALISSPTPFYRHGRLPQAASRGTCQYVKATRRCVGCVICCSYVNEVSCAARHSSSGTQRLCPRASGSAIDFLGRAATRNSPGCEWRIDACSSRAAPRDSRAQGPPLRDSWCDVRPNERIC